MPDPYYQRDGITLYHGDCLEILPTLGDGAVDAVVTDPPYSSGGMVRADRMQSTTVKYQTSGASKIHLPFAGDNKDQRSWVYWVSLWLGAAMRACVPGAMACLFSDWRQLPALTDAIQCGGWVWRGVAVWDKQNSRPVPNRFGAQAEFIAWATKGARSTQTDGASYHRGVFRVAAPATRERRHATQKPVELMEHLVVTAPPGCIVLDPFAGSGTTAVACIKTGRKFIGVEIEETYCEIAAKRIEEAFESEALLAGVGTMETAPCES